MIDLSRHPLLLKMYFYLRRLKAVLPQRWRRRLEVEHFRAKFYELLWQEAAGKVGASCERLGFGFFEIRRRGRTLRVTENICPIDDPVTLRVSLNKVLVHRLLAREGLPTPRHLAFTLKDLGKAVAFLEKVGKECVVKPADGTAGGDGITAGIRTSAALAKAAVAAASYSADLLLEEQVAGANYRLLYLDGVFLDAVLRSPPAVTGDGRSTIRQLVEGANAARLAGGPVLPQVLITTDLDMRHTLARQGLSLRSVPPAGAVVPLKTVINQGIGHDNASANHLVCDAIIEAGARAARAVGVRLAGIDVITPDPRVPLGEAGGVVLEVNAPPGYHHHHTRDGIFPVAVHVLEKLLSEPQPGGTEPSPAEIGTRAELETPSLVGRE